MITLVLICYAIYTAVMYLMTLCLYCCPGKRVSRYLGDLHASGLIVGLNCRSPDQKHPVKINILLLLLLHTCINPYVANLSILTHPKLSMVQSVQCSYLLDYPPCLMFPQSKYTDRRSYILPICTIFNQPVLNLGM